MNTSTERLALLAVFGALMTPVPGAAEGPAEGSWWFAGEGGASRVTQSFTGGHPSATKFSMALRGGVDAGPRLRVGAELGGFLMEPGDVNDPSRGRGISQVFGVAQFYAQPRHEGLYGKVGLGYANYWGQHTGDTHRAGWGASLAVGHETLTDFGAFGPVLGYTGGRLGGMRYHAVTLALSWSSR